MAEAAIWRVWRMWSTVALIWLASRRCVPGTRPPRPVIVETASIFLENLAVRRLHFFDPSPFDSQANHSADTILTTFARFGAHR